jgi:hypothetical protein
VFLPTPPSKDFETRKEQIYRSIREGRLAMVFHSLFPFSGNDWYLQCGEKVFRMGDTGPLNQKDCRFVIQSPEAFPYGRILRLWKDGEVFKEVTPHRATTEIPLESAGTYRLEVWAKARTALHILENRDIPYVFYNPIYVK